MQIAFNVKFSFAFTPFNLVDGEFCVTSHPILSPSQRLDDELSSLLGVRLEILQLESGSQL
jgi:hypothetical protein